MTDLVRSRLAALDAAVIAVTCPGLDQANAHLLTILAPEAALIHKALLAQNASGYAPGTRSQIEAGFAVAATDYLAARQFQADLRKSVEALFDRVDVLAAPSVPFVAPHEDPVIVEGQDSELLSSGFANLTGHPSISLPCGLIDGLPVGLQLTAALGQDAQLLSIARQVAKTLASR